MNIKIENLKTERQWRASTGYTKEQFYTLLDLFEKSYYIVL